MVFSLCSSSWWALGDGVLENADFRYLDAHAVPRLQPHRRLAEGADPGRRAGGDHVAGLEAHVLRDVFDQPRDRKYHVRRMALLHGLAVDEARNIQRLRIRDF